MDAEMAEAEAAQQAGGGGAAAAPSDAENTDANRPAAEGGCSGGLGWAGLGWAGFVGAACWARKFGVPWQGSGRESVGPQPGCWALPGDKESHWPQLLTPDLRCCCRARAGEKEGGEAAAAGAPAEGGAAPVPAPKKKAEKIERAKFDNIKVGRQAPAPSWSFPFWVLLKVALVAAASPVCAPCLPSLRRPLLPSPAASSRPPARQQGRAERHAAAQRLASPPYAAPPLHPSPPAPARRPPARVQQLLVFRLRQLEGEEAEGAERMDDGLNALAGCRQKDLLQWYYNYLAKK